MVVNLTPEKDLLSCDAEQGAIFKVNLEGCNLEFENLSSLPAITNIEYEVSIDGDVADTINTTDDNYIWRKASLYPDASLSIKQTITSGLGTFENTLPYLTPPFEGCYIVYQSNAAGVDTVDPSVIDGTAESFWRFPDNVARTGNSQSYTGSAVGFDGTIQNVYYHCTDYSQLTTFSLKDDKVVGVPNLFILTDCTTFELDTNPGITNVVLPAPNSNIVVLDLQSCGLGPNFSLLPLGDKLAGNIFLNNNSELETVDIPASSNDCDLRLNDCDMQPSIDISMLTGITSFVINNNPNLNEIINGTHAAAWTTYWAFDCDIDVAFNFSGYTNFGGDVRIYGNSNCPGATNPTSPAVFTVYRADGNGFTTWVGTNLSNLGGVLRLDGNSITLVTLGSSSQVFTFIRLNDNNQTSLDLSPLTAIEGVLDFSLNNISTLTLPATSGTIDDFFGQNNSLPYVDTTNLTFASTCDIRLQDNGMSAAEVNCYLVDMDSNLPAVGTGTINIAGTNAAPDGSSGGCDGSAAKTSLQGKGYTVTTN